MELHDCRLLVGGDGTTPPGLAPPVWRVQPRPGLMVLFPPWCKHSVPPASAEEAADEAGSMRVAFSFNLVDGDWTDSNAVSPSFDLPIGDAVEGRPAVEQELYDETQQLKAGIEQLEKLGCQITKLNAQKCQAVEREDYDEAKAIKFEVDA